jgi:hypothetical protein
VRDVKRRAVAPITLPACGIAPAPNGADCVAGEMIALARESAGHGRPQALCEGDSGSPLFVAQGGRFWVAGVLSRAANAEGMEPHCGDLATYTRMTAPTRGWIAAACKALEARDCPAS